MTFSFPKTLSHAAGLLVSAAAEILARGQFLSEGYDRSGRSSLSTTPLSPVASRYAGKGVPPAGRHRRLLDHSIAVDYGHDWFIARGRM